MKRLLLFSILGILFGASVTAQAPLSAIDWLSESIKNPPTDYEFRLEPEPLIPPILPEIDMQTEIFGTSVDSIGLLAPSVTGFSANLWGNMSSSEVIDSLNAFPTRGMPEAKSLFVRILLAQSNPPFAISQDGEILSARIKRLFQMGALDEAEALISTIQTLTPPVFPAAFNVAILTDRTTKVCNALKAAPALSSDLSAKVYCLARNGDWNAAAITLSLGASIGAIDPAREEMLIRYLDPELFEGEPAPTAPNPLTPMDFTLREAVLLPRESGLLPLPYLYRDIGATAPLRTRIEASERLVKAGAMPPNLLFAAYRTGKAASSGGVWGRKSAVQTLDNALEQGNKAKPIRAITRTLKALNDAGLLHALADEYGEALAKLRYAPEYADISPKVLDLVHLADISAIEWEHHGRLNARQKLAQSLVIRSPLEIMPTTDALNVAIIKAFSDISPENPTAKRLHLMLDEGNQGKAILEALELLATGDETDPEDIITGLFILREAGQEASARRIAVQILLLPSGG